MHEMETGILGFKVPSIVELADKSVKTLSVLGPQTSWRFGKKTIVADNSSVGLIRDVIASNAKPIPGVDPCLFSASAATDACDTLPMVTFAVLSQQDDSAIRIYLTVRGALYDRVEICCSILSEIIAIWDPMEAYVKCVEQLKKDCSRILKVFPAGYAIYRRVPIVVSGDDPEVVCSPTEKGTWVRFRESFLRRHNPSCVQLDRLISVAGGVDDRFTVLQ